MIKIKIGDNMENKSQKIECNVFDCKHCNCDDCVCNLKEIKVCNCGHNEDKESTMCNSYKQRKK